MAVLLHILHTCAWLRVVKAGLLHILHVCVWSRGYVMTSKHLLTHSFISVWNQLPCVCICSIMRSECLCLMCVHLHRNEIWLFVLDVCICTIMRSECLCAWCVCICTITRSECVCLICVHLHHNVIWMLVRLMCVHLHHNEMWMCVHQHHNEMWMFALNVVLAGYSDEGLADEWSTGREGGAGYRACVWYCPFVFLTVLCVPWCVFICVLFTICVRTHVLCVSVCVSMWGSVCVCGNWCIGVDCIQICIHL